MMSNDLSVQAVRAVTTPGNAAKGSGSGAAPATAPVAALHRVYTNPTLRLDPALGLVVIQYHDAAGDVTASYPSQRQLDAYRVHQQSMPERGTPDATNASVSSPGVSSSRSLDAAHAPAEPALAYAKRVQTSE